MPDLLGVRVLVVEDEGTIAFLLEEMLEDLGCEVAASVATVARAEAVLDSAALDLALLDVNLAGETTIGFANGLAGRAIPFVFSTGYGTGGLPAELQDRPILTKPFSPADLRRALEQALLPAA